MIMTLAQFAEQSATVIYCPIQDHKIMIIVSLLMATSLLKVVFYFCFIVISTWGPPTNDVPKGSKIA